MFILACHFVLTQMFPLPARLLMCSPPWMRDVLHLPCGKCVKDYRLKHCGGIVLIPHQKKNKLVSSKGQELICTGVMVLQWLALLLYIWFWVLRGVYMHLLLYSVFSLEAPVSSHNPV